MTESTVAFAVLQVAAITVLTRWILLRLPAPVDEPDSDPYRPLATPGFAVTVAALALVATGLVTTLVPPALQPAWAALNSCGILLGCIDARTTFLPLRLTQAAWLLGVLGIGVTAWLRGDAWILLRAGIGAFVAAGLFFLFWRFAGGFGFGDVRLAALIGGITATISPGFAFLSLTAGSVAGVVWGLAVLAAKRERAYPYGPALVAGPYLALILQLFLP